MRVTRRGFLGGSLLASTAPLPTVARAEEGEALRCGVNGARHELEVGEDETAIHLLRERLGLTGTKLACGHGACGACTILVDGEPHVSCLLPASALKGREVTTIEAIEHPVQVAFAMDDALQCGYCTPGFVVEAVAFHDRWREAHGVSEPPREAVDEALAGHLCRCGAYQQIVAAVQAACAGRYDDVVPAPERVDAMEKVTGRAVFTVDVTHEGQLEGRILRSPHAHARIRAFDDAGARALGATVVRFVEDGGGVRYAGQEVAAVAAVDAETAEEALRRIVVDYEVLPAVIGAEAAVAPGAPLVYPKAKHRHPESSAEGLVPPGGWDGNARGPTPSSFGAHPGRAKRAVEEGDGVAGTWRTQVQCHTALEPHAAVARWLPDGSLEVHVSSQGCSVMHDDLADHFGLRRDAVRVLVPFVGGAFGAKAGLQMEAVAAVELARAAGAPVRVVLPRTDEMIAGGTRPGTRTEIALAVDPDGGLAIRADTWSDGGVSVGNNTGFVLRLLYPDAAKALRDWDVVSHAPPGKPFRAPGGVQAFFALEQGMDTLAAKLGEDPIAMRRRWDPSPIRNRLYDWVEAQPAWRDRAPDRGRHRRGVGFAAAAWPAFVQPNSQVQLDAGPDGVAVSTAAQDMGNGTRSALAAAAARALGIAASEVTVRIGDSNLVHGPISSGSRTTASLAPIVDDLVAELKEILVEVAEEQLGLVAPVYEPGGLRHDGGFLPLREVLAVTPPTTLVGRRRRDEVGWFLPFNVVEGNAIKTVGVSAQLCQVEVDTRLGRVRVVETWTGMGVGNLLTPRVARSQVESAVVQSVGYTLYEERRLDPGTGWILTSGLEDYRLTGIGDVPRMNVHFDEEGFEGVSGHRIGLGELGMLGVAPAIASAVAFATGWRPDRLPIRPDRVLKGLA